MSEDKQTNNERLMVASIVSNDRLALNKGSDDNIRMGERYLVYSETDEEVTDPVTGESLGKLELPRGTGVIIHVTPKYSILESDTPPEKSDISSVLGATLPMPGEKAPFRGVSEKDSVKFVRPTIFGR